MRPLRIATLAFAWALLAETLAPAQVAAPRLTPAFPGLPSQYGLHWSMLDASNPAALAWAQSSYVGLGSSFNGAASDQQGRSGQTRGTVVQTRLVGSNVSLGLARIGSHMDLFNAISPRPGFDSEDAHFDLALHFADWLALGLAKHNLRADRTDLAVPMSDTRRRRLDLGGASLRLGEHIALGIAQGTETIQFQKPGATDSTQREVKRVGVAYSSYSPESAWHLEFYREQRDPYSLAAAFPGDVYDGTRLTGMTLEVNWNGWLMAYERIDQSVNDFLSPTPFVYKAPAQSITVGSLHRSGVAVLLNYNWGQRQVTGNPVSYRSTWLTASWLF
jgi:hypothetical protein